MSMDEQERMQYMEDSLKKADEEVVTLNVMVTVNSSTDEIAEEIAKAIKTYKAGGQK